MKYDAFSGGDLLNAVNLRCLYIDYLNTAFILSYIEFVIYVKNSLILNSVFMFFCA